MKGSPQSADLIKRLDWAQSRMGGSVHVVPVEMPSGPSTVLTTTAQGRSPIRRQRLPLERLTWREVVPPDWARGNQFQSTHDPDRSPRPHRMIHASIQRPSCQAPDAGAPSLSAPLWGPQVVSIGNGAVENRHWAPICQPRFRSCLRTYADATPQPPGHHQVLSRRAPRTRSSNRGVGARTGPQNEIRPVHDAATLSAWRGCSALMMAATAVWPFPCRCLISPAPRRLPEAVARCGAAAPDHER